MSLLFTSAAAPQNARFTTVVSTAVPASDIPSLSPPCSTGRAKANPGESEERTVLADLRAACGASSAGSPMDDPCKTAVLTLASCAAREDPIPAELGAMGKQGHKILLARGEVLAILQGSNVCRAWYEEKVPDPAAIFRRIAFALDRKGEDSVTEIRGTNSLTVFRSPYVARVTQGDGPNATITVNSSGAFFWVSANVQLVDREGGPFKQHGERWLRVGPYLGDSQQAQVVTLLHEFGHAVDLLPTDGNGMDGKSGRNTEEVLRHCRNEVETRSNTNYPALAH